MSIGFTGENKINIWQNVIYWRRWNSWSFIAYRFWKGFWYLILEFYKTNCRSFNFGPSIRQWVKIFYMNLISAVNQSLYKVFDFWKQGDPLSPYTYLICAEIWQYEFLKNKKINGIAVGNITKKDFSTCGWHLYYSGLRERQLKRNHFYITYMLISKMSGLCINYSKTHSVWIG